jgi:ferrochelatase
VGLPSVSLGFLQERRRGILVGFLVDHIEVLYDLDVEAAAAAEEVGLTIARASAVNDHPSFEDMMAQVVLTTVRQYSRGRPLPVVPLPA